MNQFSIDSKEWLVQNFCFGQIFFEMVISHWTMHFLHPIVMSAQHQQKTRIRWYQIHVSDETFTGIVVGFITFISSLSVLLVWPKWMLAPSHAAPWWVTVCFSDGTDGWMPSFLLYAANLRWSFQVTADHCIFCISCCLHITNCDLCIFIDSMYLSERIGQLSSVDDVNKLLKHCLASISSLITHFPFTGGDCDGCGGN